MATGLLRVAMAMTVPAPSLPAALLWRPTGTPTRRFPSLALQLGAAQRQRAAAERIVTRMHAWDPARSASTLPDSGCPSRRSAATGGIGSSLFLRASARFGGDGPSHEPGGSEGE